MIQAVWSMARADLRRQWASLALLAVLVSLVITAVLATTAGARRSASALDRMLEGTDARDVRVGVFGADIPDELRERIGAIDGVDAVGMASSTVAGVETDFDALLLASPDDSSLRRIDRPVVLDGRMPHRDEPRELAVNEMAAEQLDLRAGDRLEVPTFSPEGWETLTSGGEFPGFDGPLIEFDVVGVVRMPDDLIGESKDATPMLLATPAFLEQHRSEIAWPGTIASVRTDDPAAVAEVLAVADTYSAEGYEGFAGTVDDDFGSGVRDAISVVVVGLTAMAVVAAVGGLLAIGQATSRQILRRRDETSVASALGLTRHQNALAMALPPAAGVMVGASLGTVGAYAVSGLFPLAVARRAEIDPGTAADVPVLLGGFLVLALLGSGWAYLVARRVTRRTPTYRPSDIGIGRWLRVRARPTVRLGVDRALGAGFHDRRAAGRMAIAGAAVGIGGVVAVLVLAASLQTSLDRPEWWGWTWTSRPDLLDPSQFDDGAVAALGEEDGVAAVGLLQRGSVEIDGERQTANALETVNGHLSLALIDGRLPVSDDEVALGTETLEDLHVGVGGTIETKTLDGDTVSLRVVGRVAMPLIDNVVPGDGLVVTAERLATIAPELENDVVLRYEPGVDSDALEQRLLEKYGLDTSSSYARPAPPSRLSNVEEAVGLLPALAGFFLVLAALALLHALVVSARDGRLEFGLLAALGLLRSQNRRVIGWQSFVTVALGVVVGVPIGAVVGRTTWKLLVSDVGMLGGPTVPLPAVAFSVGAALAVAIALAWPVGRHFAKGLPAELLRVE